MASKEKVILVGLGAIAQTHIRVLGQIPTVNIVCGVDSRSDACLVFRGKRVAVYHSVRAASRSCDASVVIIATPTPDHAALCSEVSEYYPNARILVEKPAADNLADALYILERIGSRQSLDVAYHVAFSPEVRWGAQIVHQNRAVLGTAVAVEAAFADPYCNKFEAAEASLVNSWIDSGINSLSVLSRFLDPVNLLSFRRIGIRSESVFEAHVECYDENIGLEAVILTTWHVADGSKSTRIKYDSGAELVMDHTAVAGYLLQHKRIAAVFGVDQSAPRRERHYYNLYDDWLVKGNRAISAETSVRLHHLLLDRSEEFRQIVAVGPMGLAAEVAVANALAYPDVDDAGDIRITTDVGRLLGFKRDELLLRYEHALPAG